jgi:aldehyde dehydrogenase (NAD+)
VPGSERSRLMNKLADLMEKHMEELVALEMLNVGASRPPKTRIYSSLTTSFDTGKTYGPAKGFDVASSIYTIRYYAGWADKIHGKTIETRDTKMAYTRHEPYGVVVRVYFARICLFDAHMRLKGLHCSVELPIGAFLRVTQLPLSCSDL